MKLYFRNNTQNNWKLLFSNPKNTLNFFLNFFVCLIFYFMAIHWVKNNATAAGSILFDPIQKHFHSIDFVIGCIDVRPMLQHLQDVYGILRFLLLKSDVLLRLYAQPLENAPRFY